jgi:hypothetical protein
MMATAIVGGAWSGAEFPEHALDRIEWGELFDLAGYTVDGQAAQRPTEPLTLLPGRPGIPPDRMASTVSPERAEWFARRPIWPAPGTVGVAQVEPQRPLAHIHEGGRSEHEYLINPEGLAIARHPASADAAGESRPSVST